MVESPKQKLNYFMCLSEERRYTLHVAILLSYLVAGRKNLICVLFIFRQPSVLSCRERRLINLLYLRVVRNAFWNIDRLGNKLNLIKLSCVLLFLEWFTELAAACNVIHLPGFPHWFLSLFSCLHPSPFKPYILFIIYLPHHRHPPFWLFWWILC